MVWQDGDNKGNACKDRHSMIRMTPGKGEKRWWIKDRIIFLSLIFWNISGSAYLCTPQNGRLAQLVQSACLTSRRSLVRIQYRPQPQSLARSAGLFCFRTRVNLFTQWEETKQPDVSAASKGFGDGYKGPGFWITQVIRFPPPHNCKTVEDE